MTKGDAESERGTPDRIGCYAGFALAVEFKQPGTYGKRSRQVVQRHQLQRWRNAGAVAVYVDSPRRMREVLDAISDARVRAELDRQVFPAREVNERFPLAPAPPPVHVKEMSL